MPMSRIRKRISSAAATLTSTPGSFPSGLRHRIQPLRSDARKLTEHYEQLVSLSELAQWHHVYYKERLKHMFQHMPEDLRTSTRQVVAGLERPLPVIHDLGAVPPIPPPCEAFTRQISRTSGQAASKDSDDEFLRCIELLSTARSVVSTVQAQVGSMRAEVSELAVLCTQAETHFSRSGLERVMSNFEREFDGHALMGTQQSIVSLSKLSSGVLILAENGASSFVGEIDMSVPTEFIEGESAELTLTPEIAQRVLFQRKMTLEQKRSFVNMMRAPKSGISVCMRSWRLRRFPRCFIGKEATSWFMSTYQLHTREEAVALGNLLLQHGVFHHVKYDHTFKDEHLFYRFQEDEDGDLLNATSIVPEIGAEKDPLALSANLVRAAVSLLKVHWPEQPAFQTSISSVLQVPSKASILARRPKSGAFWLMQRCDPLLGPFVWSAEVRHTVLLLAPSPYDGGAEKVALMLNTIQHAKEWNGFCALAKRLVGVDAGALQENSLHHTVFWVNVYNALMFHTMVVRGWPTTHGGRNTLFCTTRYRVGKGTLTLNEIEHGVLRGNAIVPGGLKPTFAASDERTGLCAPEPDPSIHFVLHVFTEQSPELMVLTRERAEFQLAYATQRYLLRTLQIDLSRRTIQLPRLFRWYRSDFEGGPEQFLFSVLSNTDLAMDGLDLAVHSVLVKALHIKLIALSEPKSFQVLKLPVLSEQYDKEAAAIASPALLSWLQRQILDAAPHAAAESSMPAHTLPAMQTIMSASRRPLTEHVLRAGVSIIFHRYSWELRGLSALNM